jgi:predicted ATPase
MELLERESFLHTLAEYAGEARQGDGRLVLVSGESGSVRPRWSRRSASG